MSAIGRIWNVQTGSANEINLILSQIMQRFDQIDVKISDIETAIDTFTINWCYDWEKDYYRSDI